MCQVICEADLLDAARDAAESEQFLEPWDHLGPECVVCGEAPETGSAYCRRCCKLLERSKAGDARSAIRLAELSRMAAA